MPPQQKAPSAVPALFLIIFSIVVIPIGVYLLPNFAPSDMASRHVNVFRQPLSILSREPMTGFYRDGYCRVGPEDTGNHAVAGVMTDEFLDFTAARGNNLRAAGLTAGCKWCLCAARWKEAMLARSGDRDPVVPKVLLQSTDFSALRSVGLEDLRKFALDEPPTNGVNGDGH